MSIDANILINTNYTNEFLFVSLVNSYIRIDTVSAEQK